MNISEQIHSTNEKEDVMTNNIQSQELNVFTKCLQWFDEVVQLYHHCPGDILDKGYTIPKNPTQTQHPP